jgi:hypothetical protein
MQLCSLCYFADTNLRRECAFNPQGGVDMSAVAPITDLTAVPSLHLVEAKADAREDMHAKEMNRWMLWFGMPVLGMAIFTGAVFATGAEWLLGGALAFLFADICVLMWLCMSSDTNGLLGDAPAH